MIKDHFISAFVLSTAISLGLCASGIAQQPDVPTTNTKQMKHDFLNLPADTRPGCYWYWINDNVSLDGITKDLEAMACVGIGRAYIGHIFNNSGAKSDTPVGNVQFMTDAWWEAVQWAVKEGGRCGVEIGFFNSPGWSQSGGPWMKTSESMRSLIHSEMVITGGGHIDQLIPIPEITTFPFSDGYNPVATGPKYTEQEFQDVRLIAFRQPETETHDIDMTGVSTVSEDIKDLAKLFDEDDDTFVKLTRGNRYVIDLTFEQKITSRTGVQSLCIELAKLNNKYVLNCEIESSNDGQTWTMIGSSSEERGHQGIKAQKAPILIPFAETKAKYLRLTFQVTRGANLSEIRLSRSAVLGHYVRKQLGETSPSIAPPWDAYVWDEQGESAAATAVVSGEVLDLSAMMDESGRLKWDAPKGTWVVMRMGMVPMGTQSAPTSPESRGLEVDKMSRKHVATLFNGMVGEFLRRTPAEDRTALKYVIADSYETGPQNWTDGFIEKFEARFGYSPERFMPVLSGRVVDSPEVSTRFLWDMRRLIVESIAYEYVGGLRDISNNHDLTVWLENYGHWGFPSEFALYGSQTNQVGAEFWATSEPLNNVECRTASSCAHTYGKNSVYAEAYTAHSNFKLSLASLKNWCDWSYGAGVNHQILHVFIHQPDERAPGIIQWFGTAFNRHNTWFGQSKAFIDYTRRSTVLLKAGVPVVDVAYYIGENAPAMAGPRDPALPDGYDFDYINSDALINRTCVKNGRIVVKDGPGYAVLVLPKQKVMRPEVAEAIARLVRKGATVIGPEPERSPSLEDYPRCDNKLRTIAEDLWAGDDGEQLKKHQYGRGYVYDGVSLEEVFDGQGIEPDIEILSEGDVLCAAAGAGKISIGQKGGIVFKHRAGKKTDVYFLANTSDESIEFTASLRQVGRQPWLWDAVRGEIRQAFAFNQQDGRTHVPLTLAASESIFVVLEGKIKKNTAGKAIANTPDTKMLLTLDGEWTLRFNGRNAPEEITFANLSDWAQHPDPAIKHYAGTAVYEKSFRLPAISHEKPVILELGEVGVIATVTVNGKEAGTVWTTPWEIDISDCVVDGNNELKIRVANTWNNRLVADAALPIEERQSFVSQSYRFKKDAPLVKSGLLGPVKIKH